MMAQTATAETVIADLQSAADPADRDYVAKFYTGGDPQTKILGVRMPKVFPIAKAHRDLSLSEVSRLLDDPYYEVRMAAVSILDAKARLKSLPEDERRTAIVATFAFLKRGETEDTFKVAAKLAGDPDTYVQKALGSWLREAGKRDPGPLAAFLDRHKNTLPRPTKTAAARLLPEKLRPD